jgi:hypothetical protein
MQRRRRVRPPAAVPAAAAPAPAPAPGPSLSPADEPAWDKEKGQALMLAIFGGDYDPEAERGLAVIKDEGEDAWFRMTLAGVAELPDGRTIVAVNGSPSNEDGGDEAGHASSGMLNVYVLRRDGAAWKVLARHENVASMGSSGYIGSVKWVSLAQGKPGFIVSSGGVWQGYTVSVADVFEIAEKVRALGGFRESSSSAGACVAGMEDCWDVDSSIRFVDSPHGGAYRDMLVDFKGKHYTVTEGKGGADVEHLKSTVQQTARYHFDGNAYVLVSGANPVPGV